MNILDIIIILVLAYAVYGGLKEGVILQVCSLVGIFLGLYLAGQYAEPVTKLLGFKGEYSSLWGYAIVVVCSIIAVSGVAYALRKVLHVAGLGVFDAILGVALSLCKYLLIMSVIFTVFNTINGIYNVMSPSDLNQSKLFTPIANLTEWITPAWDWTQDQIKHI